MADKKEWVDYCTSIKPGNEKYETVEKVIAGTGCTLENATLTACLTKNKKDWRQCQKESVSLAACLKSQ